MGEEIQISKILSPNDLGETGSHQAGILIPKQSPVVIHFFPTLGSSQKNPRKKICFVDAQEKCWFFNFIYYNNKSFGGTRNEHRLTGMVPFFKYYGLRSGDEVIFGKKSENGEEQYSINSSKTGGSKAKDVPHKVKLSSKWKIIRLNNKGETK